VAVRSRQQGPLAIAADDRTSALRPEPQAGKMPVGPDHLLGAAEQRAPRLGHGFGDIHFLGERGIAMRGKGGRGPVRDRALPAQDRGQTSLDQRRRQRMRELPTGSALIRTGLLVADEARRKAAVGGRRTQAGREEHEPRRRAQFTP
jgi:hypothetical protein